MIKFMYKYYVICIISFKDIYDKYMSYDSGKENEHLRCSLALYCTMSPKCLHVCYLVISFLENDKPASWNPHEKGEL